MPTGRPLGWSPVETAIRNAILDELEQDSTASSDCAGLGAFIRDLAMRKIGKTTTETGNHALVDLCLRAENA